MASISNVSIDELNNTNTTATTTTTTANDIISSERQIKLAVLLPFQVLSLLFSLFILGNIFYRPSKYLKPIQNHFLVALLLTSFIQVSTELSMVEDYLNVGFVRPSTPSYCAFFNWFEFTLNGISLSVMCWASIERHIIIFSNYIYQIQWKRIVFHYIPLTITIVYAPIYYTYAIYIYQCVNSWNYYETLCTAPCYLQNKSYGIVNWIVNIITPAFSIAIANILLILRVIFRSTGLADNAERRKKNRKMTLQLLAISSLFLIFWLPIAITGLIQQFFYPTFLIFVQYNVFFYLIYFVQLFIPFVCLVFLPDLQKTIRDQCRRCRRRNVVASGTATQTASAMPTARH